jgi:hypothetical protein
MAETITLTYSAGSFTKSRTVPNGSGTRIIAAAKARLNMPAATNAQVFDAIADEFFSVLRQTTLNYEREQARITSDATITDIPLT